MSDRLRRHPRTPHAGPVKISWQDSSGADRWARGKCVDVSEGGLRIELLDEIPINTRVILSAESLHISGSAVVKNASRKGLKLLIGLELAQKTPLSRPGASRTAVVN